MRRLRPVSPTSPGCRRMFGAPPCRMQAGHSCHAQIKRDHCVITTCRVPPLHRHSQARVNFQCENTRDKPPRVGAEYTRGAAVSRHRDTASRTPSDFCVNRCNCTNRVKTRYLLNIYHSTINGCVLLHCGVLIGLCVVRIRYLRRK